MSARPAALAFDAVATAFESRFGAWQSVAAQRRAVRAALAAALPPGARVLEIGGGIGEDAAWLARRGFRVTLTDPAPRMVAQAHARLAPLGGDALLLAAEEIETFAGAHEAAFDAVFSNFAPLNCVEDLVPVARGLAQLVRPGGAALLIVFGTFCPGEMLVEILRRRPGNALRRRKRGAVAARLGGCDFTVTYHRRADIVTAMAPHFRLIQRRGIGIFVPPSAAEPWISRHPLLLGALEAMDHLAARPLVALGDHVLYRFERQP